MLRFLTGWLTLIRYRRKLNHFSHSWANNRQVNRWMLKTHEIIRCWRTTTTVVDLSAVPLLPGKEIPGNIGGKGFVWTLEKPVMISLVLNYPMLCHHLWHTVSWRTHFPVWQVFSEPCIFNHLKSKISKKVVDVWQFNNWICEFDGTQYAEVSQVPCGINKLFIQYVPLYHAVV